MDCRHNILVFSFRKAILVLFGFLLVAPGLGAQTTVKLPLPVDSPLNALTFDVPAPSGAVLTGFLIPSSRPLDAWAPVWSTLRADGSLKESSSGGWTGPRPDKWLKVVKDGFVVGGFRFLVRTGPGSVQTRQAQIFWKPWTAGEPRGEAVTSRVYGPAAAEADTVRIVEITLPEGAVPTGFYGQTLAGTAVQISLIVKQAPAPPAAAPAAGTAPKGAVSPASPSVQSAGPRVPVVPPVVLQPPP